MAAEKAGKTEAKAPYSEEEKLILRDHLAIDRTILANERTLLAYVRTALAFFIAAAGMIHFFTDLLAQMAGWAMVPAGILTLVIGFYRYNTMRCAASEMKENDPFRH
jgi:putative membrane protein